MQSVAPSAVLNEVHASDNVFYRTSFKSVMLNTTKIENTTFFVAHKANKDCGRDLKKASNKKGSHFYQSCD